MLSQNFSEPHSIEDQSMAAFLAVSVIDKEFLANGPGPLYGVLRTAYALPE